MTKLVIVLYMWLPGVMTMAKHLETFWGLSLIRVEMRTKLPAGCRKIAAFRDRSCWNAVRTETEKLQAKDRIVLTVLPPLRSKALRMYGGLGLVGQGLSLVHCRRHNLKLCSLIAAHEIGHNFGLNHIQGEHLMNPAVTQWLEKWGWNWKL
jgi:hypothetical protein